MKFGQEFQSTLERGEYPQEWVHSAISYKQLKKCIKRVRQELLSLGLDHETLKRLWATDTGMQRHLQYTLDDETVSFVPKLVIALDPNDGTPMDAWLSPETRRALKELTKEPRRSTGLLACQKMPSRSSSIGRDTSDLETIEVPLTADSEFFHILRKELISLQRLQQEEQAQLQAEIAALGERLRSLKNSKSRQSKAELEAWRKVFKQYIDAEVFLSSHEQDAGIRSVKHAQKQLQAFNQILYIKRGDGTLKLSQDAAASVEQFLNLNRHLLLLLSFQEINRIALNKIMKKFDKQTALRAQESLSDTLNSGPLITEDLAKQTCQTITTELLTVVPQLDDYLCPVCFSISYKPIRLRCGHVFCIRCMVVMQRAEQDNCPLCRKGVVMEATEGNLDKQLMQFLKTEFKEEAKEKQRANEIAAGVDQFGEHYIEKVGNHRCVVM